MTNVRCAIYTRKSSEEGLEQGFNSLHAQREACAAYITSQVGEGWTALPTLYDDGGFSGGSMDRPALNLMLTDIARRAIDVVVVYKVDRLTRSLADFARIVERFDAHGVSFVSVTQAFNTTTSMGRLTLNVLLSFAQFEREITAERIRDKIAASKAKGMWMGGQLPLGYDVADHKLVVNAAEAETVRMLFRRYLELGSVRLLQDDLARHGVRSKQWVTREGKSTGGRRLGRGALYHLLSNPVYRGGIRHREKIYENAHPAIIDTQLWDRAQATLRENGPDKPRTPRLAAQALLRDLLFDDLGQRMTVIHTCKQGKRYRYYASAKNPDKPKPSGSLSRIAIGTIDAYITETVSPLLSRGWAPADSLDERVRAALVRIEVGADQVSVHLRRAALTASAVQTSDTKRIDDDIVAMDRVVRLKHPRVATKVWTPDTSERRHVDRSLVRAVCLARLWAAQLARGEFKTICALAKHYGYRDHYVGDLLMLAWLAPDQVTAILDGRQPVSLTVLALTKPPLPLDWSKQRRLFSGRSKS
jgi:DNA invertase Pin-like site-specific DNA recombinase